jgi:acyl-CoA reductase-like NAD-dependent aldehyde dehydrogenase
MTTQVIRLLDIENARDAIWDGDWLPVAHTLRTYEPVTGETLAIIGAGSFDDVARAAVAAAEGHPSWAATPVMTFATMMRRSPSPTTPNTA